MNLVNRMLAVEMMMAMRKVQVMAVVVHKEDTTMMTMKKMINVCAESTVNKMKSWAMPNSKLEFHSVCSNYVMH